MRVRISGAIVQYMGRLDAIIPCHTTGKNPGARLHRDLPAGLRHHSDAYHVDFDRFRCCCRRHVPPIHQLEKELLTHS